jgi:hypothetical protein
VRDEFSPEQRIAIEVMRVAGTKDPEAVARADRVGAALAGAHLRPVLTRLCDAAIVALEECQRILAQADERVVSEAERILAENVEDE